MLSGISKTFLRHLRVLEVSVIMLCKLELEIRGLTHAEKLLRKINLIEIHLERDGELFKEIQHMRITNDNPAGPFNGKTERLFLKHLLTPMRISYSN